MICWTTYWCQIRIHQQLSDSFFSHILFTQQIHIPQFNRPHISVFTTMHTSSEQFSPDHILNGCYEHFSNFLTEELWEKCTKMNSNRLNTSRYFSLRLCSYWNCQSSFTFRKIESTHLTFNDTCSYLTSLYFKER